MAAPNDRNAICDGFRPTIMRDVLFTSGGKTYTWMDRNLGASRAANTQTYNNGTIFGKYWTSTISTFARQSRMLQFGVNSGFIDNMSRSWGMAVRCIKD